MMACTDRHFRHVLRLMAQKALLYTEMVVADALLHGDQRRFLGHERDEPVALQLGGSDPGKLAQCARLGEQAGYAEINLNVGCPSDRVQVGGIGACLMADAGLVADCFSAMASTTSVPVTIKSRIGIDDQDSFEFFNQFVETLYQAGCRVFIVHARAAILNGLSPQQNRDIPPLKYDYVYRIKTLFPDAQFIINGGLKSVEDTLNEFDRTDGVMLGRAIYNNPWLLAELEHRLLASPLPDRTRVISGIRDYLSQQLAEGTAIRHTGKHLLHLFPGIPGARAYRRYLSDHMFKTDADISVFDNALKQLDPPTRLEMAS